MAKDLEAAGIPYQDDEGRYRDFHALRSSFVTNLIRSGANAKITQNLARHSDPNMTLGVYARLGSDDERHAVEGLPSLDLPESQRQRATGTESVLASRLASEGANQCQTVTPGADPNRPQQAAKPAEVVKDGGGGGSRTRVPELTSTGVYVRIPWFVSRPRDAHEQASIGPAPESSRRFAPEQDSPSQPTSGVRTRPWATPVRTAT